MCVFSLLVRRRLLFAPQKSVTRMRGDISTLVSVTTNSHSKTRVGAGQLLSVWQDQIDRQVFIQNRSRIIHLLAIYTQDGFSNHCTHSLVPQNTKLCPQVAPLW